MKAKGKIPKMEAKSNLYILEKKIFEIQET